MKRSALLLVVLFTLCCQTQIHTEPDSQKITADQVLKVLQSRGLPLFNVTVFSASDDPNKLLGRPRQYIEKISWKSAPDAPDYQDGTIEAFNSYADADARKAYVEAVSKYAPPLSQYVFVHKNIALRLDHSILPDEAEKYRSALESL